MSQSSASHGLVSYIISLCKARKPPSSGLGARDLPGFEADFVPHLGFPTDKFRKAEGADFVLVFAEGTTDEVAIVVIIEAGEVAIAYVAGHDGEFLTAATFPVLAVSPASQFHLPLSDEGGEVGVGGWNDFFDEGCLDVRRDFTVVQKEDFFAVGAGDVVVIVSRVVHA